MHVCVDKTDLLTSAVTKALRFCVMTMIVVNVRDRLWTVALKMFAFAFSSHGMYRFF